MTDPFSTEQGGIQATMQDYVDELVAEDYGVPAVDAAACAADTGALFGGFALEKGLMLATGSMRRQWRPQPCRTFAPVSQSRPQRRLLAQAYCKFSSSCKFGHRSPSVSANRARRSSLGTAACCLAHQ